MTVNRAVVKVRHWLHLDWHCIWCQNEGSYRWLDRHHCWQKEAGLRDLQNSLPPGPWLFASTNDFYGSAPWGNTVTTPVEEVC